MAFPSTKKTHISYSDGIARPVGSFVFGYILAENQTARSEIVICLLIPFFSRFARIFSTEPVFSTILGTDFIEQTNCSRMKMFRVFTQSMLPARRLLAG